MGKAVGDKIDKMDAQRNSRNRKIKFFLDKMKAEGEQQDSFAKLVKDLFVNKMALPIKKIMVAVGGFLLVLVLLIAVTVLPVVAVIAILCSFTCTDTLYGKSLATDVDDILIINTYTEANPWSNDFITSIVNMASQNSHIGVYTAHMKMLTLDEEIKLETFKESLFKSYKNPKLIVLIGCGSFIMCDELNRQWPDIPMI